MTPMKHHRSAMIGLLIFVLLPWAMAQQDRPGSGSTSGDSSTGSRGDGSRQPTGRSGLGLPRQQGMRLLFVSGRVVMEDGTPPPLGIVIERSCSSVVRKEATVDSSGNFSFQIGGEARTSNVFQDASDDSSSELERLGVRTPRSFGRAAAMDPLSSTNLLGCELRAHLAGYRSSAVIMDGNAMSSPLDVGTIVLHPIAKIQGTRVSVTSLQASKPAQRSLDRALKAIPKRRFEEAETHLKAAVAAYPRYAEAWVNLGQIYQEQNRLPEARQAYQEAIAADSKFVNPYIQLARIAGLQGKWQEVAELTDHALALDPLDFPEGFFFNAAAYCHMNQLDVAEKSARKTIRLDPRHRIPQVHLVLAEILQRRSDIAGAVEQLHDYLRYAPGGASTEKVHLQLRELEKIAATRVIMPTEHP